MFGVTRVEFSLASENRSRTTCSRFLQSVALPDEYGSTPTLMKKQQKTATRWFDLSFASFLVCSRNPGASHHYVIVCRVLSHVSDCSDIRAYPFFWFVFADELFCFDTLSRNRAHPCPPVTNVMVLHVPSSCLHGHARDPLTARTFSRKVLIDFSSKLCRWRSEVQVASPCVCALIFHGVGPAS